MGKNPVFISVGEVSRSYNIDSGQSWESSNHSSLRFLWRMFTQVRVDHRLALLYRDLWLSQSFCHHRRNSM